MQRPCRGAGAVPARSLPSGTLGPVAARAASSPGRGAFRPVRGDGPGGARNPGGDGPDCDATLCKHCVNRCEQYEISYMLGSAAVIRARFSIAELTVGTPRTG